tara:strand:+ start:327 stop:773 length:447 start_codon:yes stop_codon:yes gene_type:complete
MFNLFNKGQKLVIKDLNNDDKNSLIASILIECGYEDGNLSEEEKLRISLILEKKLKLPNADVNKIIQDALDNKNKSVEIYSLIRDLREKLPHDEILNLFVSMWEVILIDNNIDDFEAALMRKLVGLFHITDRESADARKKALINIKNH